MAPVAALTPSIAGEARPLAKPSIGAKELIPEAAPSGALPAAAGAEAVPTNAADGATPPDDEPIIEAAPFVAAAPVASGAGVTATGVPTALTCPASAPSEPTSSVIT